VVETGVLPQGEVPNPCQTGPIWVRYQQRWCMEPKSEEGMHMHVCSEYSLHSPVGVPGLYKSKPPQTVPFGCHHGWTPAVEWVYGCRCSSLAVGYDCLPHGEAVRMTAEHGPAALPLWLWPQQHPSPCAGGEDSALSLTPHRLWSGLRPS